MGEQRFLVIVRVTDRAVAGIADRSPIAGELQGIDCVAGGYLALIVQRDRLFGILAPRLLDQMQAESTDCDAGLNGAADGRTIMEALRPGGR